MANIADITSWVQKNSSWIKTGAIFLLIGFLILVSTNAGCTRKQRDTFISEITILNLLNDSLEARNKILEDSLVISDTEKDKYIQRLLALSIRNDSLVVVAQNLTTYIDSIPSIVKKLTSDSIYKFLTTSAYPDTGKVIYPFSNNQIRKINETYLYRISAQQLITLLNKHIVNSEWRILTMDSLIVSYEKSTVILTSQNNILNETISNKNKEIEFYRTQEKHGNVNKVLWQVSTAVATVIALIFAFK